MTTPMTTASPAVAAMDKAAKAKATLETYKQSFREYLRKTGAVANDDELAQLMALLHEPLPVSFRLNLHRPDAPQIRTRLATELQFPTDTFEHNGIKVNPPTPIPWYPQPEVAWQLDCGRVALSKSAARHAPVQRFHACLLAATDAGTIDRQEAVSMLPVLFLDVARGHRVLDMCASPGSKTTQALDLLLTTSSPSTDNDDGAAAATSTTSDETPGLVVANDLDRKRAYMLVHRLSRNTLRSAVVTCGSGITFPGLYAPDGTLAMANVFDRVLCDVPCSGDGTLRKNQGLWREWHIGQGLTLHPTQLALALRGAALVRVGGRMVYSTCSFNPIENEAVVAELLRRADGALELEAVDQRLPGLITRPGRRSWPVGWRSKSKATRKGQIFTATTTTTDAEAETSLHDWYETYDALPQELRGQRVRRSMFPPAGDSAITHELPKTLRLIPIDQNSGGFFIAVLRKVRDLPGPNQEGLPELDEHHELAPPPDYVCKICHEPGHLLKYCPQYVPEDEFHPRFAEAPQPEAKKPRLDEPPASSVPVTPRETLYRPISDEAWALIRDFYGIADDHHRARLWCRSDTAANVNYVDEGIARAVLAGDALEIVNTGLKVFSKHSDKGQTYYRPAEEALGFIDRHFTQRVLRLPLADFRILLEADTHTPFTALSEATQGLLGTMSVGPAVAHLAMTDGEPEGSHTTAIAINLWIGNGAMLPRVSKTLRADVQASIDHLQPSA